MLIKLNSLMKKTNNQKGFTLVELMVVVVIIGILIAIAVPVYKNVTDKAERAAVEANLRTIDGAIMQAKMELLDGEGEIDEDVLDEYIQGGLGSLSPGDYNVIDVDGQFRAVVSGDAGGEKDMDEVTLENLPWR